MKTLTCTIVAAAAALTLSAPAEAITIPFTSTLVDNRSATTVGAFTGEVATGTVTYDETLVLADGETQLFPNRAYSADIVAPGYASIFDPTAAITWTWRGTTYGNAHADVTPNAPNFQFFDGRLVFADYWLEDGTNGVDFGGLGIDFIQITDAQFATDGTLTIDAEVNYDPTLNAVAAVPLPAAGLLLLGALGALAFGRRKA